MIYVPNEKRASFESQCKKEGIELTLIEEGNELQYSFIGDEDKVRQILVSSKKKKKQDFSNMCNFGGIKIKKEKLREYNELKEIIVSHYGSWQQAVFQMMENEVDRIERE